MTAPAARRRLLVNGIVQGVGFRPYVYNLARGMALVGEVSNTSAGVVIEVQGDPADLDTFARRLQDETPPLARITSLESTDVDPSADADGFVIVASADAPGTSTLIPPDVATCADCLREIRDPGDRRHGYPFTNCTNCGPRWTIIRHIPYDRPQTSMAPFVMCAACQAEYDDPGDRRFHAQPNACPECGPRAWLADAAGNEDDNPDPLAAAADLLAAGRIVAVKGLGGFHLAVRADDEDAVQRLRRRKHRETKPLAVMLPDLKAARRLAEITEADAAALSTPEAPIVLVPARAGGPLAPAVAPAHRRLGLMLAYTPLHHLLLDALGARGVTALVMTSGNASDEPICLGNDEARERLVGIADAWLLHDRDIVRRADDSVLQVLPDGPLFFRRSRGYAPVPVFTSGKEAAGDDVLAVGPELKNTICLLSEDRAFLSPHVGDLANLKAHEFFAETIATLQDVLEKSPALVAHDKHPGYHSTTWAKGRDAALAPVQHHHAHLAAVLAEHGLPGPAVGIILDGTGYGDDGTIWGGEVLVGDAQDFTRAAHLDPVPLPGGDAAVKAPWRTAVSYLRHAYGADLPALPWLDDHPVAPIMEMLERGFNSPLTSSCGRLFDAVAQLTGRWPEVHYEAQAAIELMAATTSEEVAAAEPLAPTGTTEPRDGTAVIPVAPMVRGAVAALADGADVAGLSARFHRTLIDLFANAAESAARGAGLDDVVLGGGVLQNEIVLVGLRRALEQRGLRVHRPVQLPPNDGGVALGQAVVARARAARPAGG